MPSSDDISKLTSQITAMEKHAKATLTLVAAARKTLAALSADIKPAPRGAGLTGGL